MGNRSSKKTFRDGSYHRFVSLGKRTVKDGECAAVWAPSGERTLVVGPKRVHLLFSHVRFLDRHIADQNQYLLIQNRDGRKETVRGPVALFFDPCRHQLITKHDAFKLSANEAIVVYKEEERVVNPEAISAEAPFPEAAIAPTNAKATTAKHAVVGLRLASAGESGSVTRRVVRGPAVFVPHATEWVHEFSWHGSLGGDGKGSKTGTIDDRKVPHAVNFSKLRCMPDHLYYTVRDVRTTDDALLSIHLMVFYELCDIEAMLDGTNDPIGDFINATSADVISFGAKNTYSSLLKTASHLNSIDTFPILAHRMGQTGFKLHKVVYRGYSASTQLQSMHDESIAKRTKLKLTSDTREMEQHGQSMELRCKAERAEQERRMQDEAVKHEMSLKALQAEQKRRELDEDHAQRMRHEEERARAALAASKLSNDEDIRRITSLKTLGVELTKYLCVTNQAQPDKHVRVETVGGGDGQQLHFKMPNLLA